MIHYSGHAPHHFSGAHYGATPYAPNVEACAEHVHAALAAQYGNHPDLPELSRYVASLCYGRTPAACRRILLVSLRYGMLASQVGQNQHGIFIRTVMRGLRQGKCFQHQQKRVAFGQDAPAAPEFDPNLFGSLVDSFVGLAQTGIQAASEAENRRFLEEAAAASGATGSEYQALLNQTAALLTQQQQQQAAASAAGNTAAAQAAMEQQNRLIADLQAQLAAKSESKGLSMGQIAGVGVGTLAAIVAIVAGVRMLGRGGQGNMHYGAHCYGGHCV